MIQVYTFPGAWGVASLSPFGLKLETWLRMMELPYQAHYPGPQGAPKGKMPYIELDGQKLGDSHLIIEELTRRHQLPDPGLTPQQRAHELALRLLVEEHLYQVGVWARWIDPSGWQHFGPVAFASLPPVVRSVVPPLARASVRKALHGHGMGRHVPAEIYRFGAEDLQALSDALGERAYFSGVPTELDAAVFGALANLLAGPIENPLTDKLRTLDNLLAFHQRVRERWWA